MSRYPLVMSLSRERLSTLLVSLGVTAVIASLVLGIGGFLTLSSMMSRASTTVRSASVVVDDVAAATRVAALSVTSIRDVIDDIESAARSGARTLRTVEGLLTDIADQAAEDVASSIESAVDAMPGIIETGRVIDRTLSALSLVGVDYDPAVPLDEALESLEQSLAPLPGEIREQVGLIEEAAGDIADLSENSSDLAASLLEIRIDLLDAEDLVTEAAFNVEEVSTQFAALADDFDTYRIWLPWLVVAAAVALAAAGAGLLLIGLNEGRDRDSSAQTPEH
jgi:methyl-accepting chemotaxis protein